MPTVLSDLETLVGFPTVSDRPVTELASFLAQRLEDVGFQVDWFHDAELPGKANLVARIGPPGTDGLVLSGHMDVVPTENQPWTSDPFAVTEREGRLYGRGTADMKGFFAATLAALDRIETYDRELVLIWTHDEEVGCLGSQRLVGKLEDPLPSQCLIGEPTGFEVLRMHPGHVALEVILEGVAAHSSRPDLGRNAIDAAGDVIFAIRSVAAELEAAATPHPEIPRNFVPVNIGVIEGGSAVNIVADRCRLVVGYRPLPGMPSEAVFELLRARILAANPAAGVTVRLLRDTPSLLTPADTPLVHLLGAHASCPGTGCASFATDGGNLAKVGTNPIVFGPGSIEVAHKADEYIPIDELHRAVDVLESVIRARCVE